MIQGKGLGNKKINRVNVSLSNENLNKLNKLSIACRLRPTTLAGFIIELALNNNDIIQILQNEHCLEKAYRIFTINDNGKIIYTLPGRSELE